MFRIKALNESSDENTEDDLERVTKEAEETIIVNEYLRALKLKSDGKKDAALALFKELLEAEAVVKVPPEEKETNKLFGVRYNCYRNVGFLYEELGNNEEALQNLVLAIETDNTDMYTLNRVGKLALSMQRPFLARRIFERCQDLNPNHWPSMDGLLDALVASTSWGAAYGWAQHCFNRNPQHKKAIQVMLDVGEMHPEAVQCLEQSYQGTINAMDYIREGPIFTGFTDEPKVVPAETLDVDSHKIDKVDWLSLGTFICKFHESLVSGNCDLTASYNLDDFIRVPDTVPYIEGLSDLSPDEPSKDVEEPMDFEQLLQPPLQPPLPTESPPAPPPLPPPDDDDVIEINGSEGNTDNESKPATEPGATATDALVAALKEDNKRRRRGSDLTNLEQWGWHKNRRSKRKKCDDIADAIDTTMNGFLRRILSSHFLESFDEPALKVPNRNETNSFQPISLTLDEFQENTKDAFDLLVTELRTSFDLVEIVAKYCQTLANQWQTYMPKSIRTTFIDVFRLHLSLIDCNTFNLFDDDEQVSYMKMSLFYLELLMDSTFEIDHFLELCTVLRFYVGFFLHNKNYFEFAGRLLWLYICFHLNANEYEQSLEYSESLQTLLESEDVTIFLPNFEQYNHFNLELIRYNIRQTKGKICLRNTKKLYAEENYEELVEILEESLLQNIECDTLVLSYCGQIQLLLESLWCLERHKDCLTWMERCLSHSVDQYLQASVHSTSQKDWAETVNFILMYFEAVVEHDEDEFIPTLESFVSRLVQSLTKIVTNQLDTELTKASQTHHINTRIPWLLLYHIVQREDDLNVSAVKAVGVDDILVLPNAVQLFFTAHEFLGRKKWCSRDDSKFLLLILDTVTPRLRSPELETARETVMELLEQVIYCLYKIKPKKQRSKYIGEHESRAIEMTWERAIQLFDIFRPDTLPEFDSYKLQSISADMEALLQKILSQMPKCLDITPFTAGIKDFINGTADQLPTEMNLMPSRIQSIYYLIADFYFKSRDFPKAIRFYVLDLTLRPQRFDSWAGLALSKSAKIESKLNSCDDFNPKEFLEDAAKVMRCYEQCLKLNDKNRVLWIEYGNFTYNVHSFCSRSLKQGNENLSIEYFEFIEGKKEQCINIAHNAFTTLTKLAESVTRRVSSNNNNADDDEDEENDEMWLYYYMLGKISEKKREDPQRYLDLYLKSAKFLYESGATYPLKISHSYPTTLSIEALEVFYRINAAIIKYLEQHPKVGRPIMKLFARVLKDLANSPFAINRAKIKNSTKRKLDAESQMNGKRVKLSTTEEAVKCNGNGVATETVEATVETNAEKVVEKVASPVAEPIPDSTMTNGTAEGHRVDQLIRAEARRSSHESSVTTTTTTTTGSSSSSSSGSSDSSSSSSSDSETSESSNLQEVTQTELDAMFKLCIKNLEECVTRFPEHYKSTYRLIYHFLHAKGATKSLQNCKQLLLSTYMTALDSKITGLFTDRKNNNFFNGIWRIPSTEIDRPGNFSAHLSKCTSMLIEVLKHVTDYQVLFELALNLHKTPEADKKYLKETERKELFQQAILFCVQSFRALLKKHQETKDDPAVLNLLIEIYKIHRKSIKYMQQKESLFSSVLTDVYKAYVENKAKLPENANLLDLAVKLCCHELNLRKQREKAAAAPPSTDPVTSTTNSPSSMVLASASMLPGAEAPIYIPGLTKRKSVEKKPKPPPPLPPSIIEPPKLPTQAEVTALLAELQRNTAQPSPMPLNLPSNPNELQTILSMMQQQSLLYSQLTALATTSSAPNYNQFAMKYIESLATSYMANCGTQMKSSPPTIKSGKLAQSFGTPKTSKNISPKPKPKALQAASSSTAYNNILPFDLPQATSMEKVLPPEKVENMQLKSLLKPSVVKPKMQISVRNDLLNPTKPKPSPKFEQPINTFKPAPIQSASKSSPNLSRPWVQQPQKPPPPPPSAPSQVKPKKPKPMQLPTDLPKSLTITPSPVAQLPRQKQAAKQTNTPKITLLPLKSAQAASTQAASHANAFLLEYTKKLQLDSSLTIDLTASPRKQQVPKMNTPKASTSRLPNSLTNGTKYGGGGSSMASTLNIPNSISVSPVPSNSSVQSLSPIGSNKSYSPLSRNYRPASISPVIESSPTKTLQEKLAEKQKANQEMKLNPLYTQQPKFVPHTNHRSSFTKKADNANTKKKAEEEVVIVLDD